MISRKMAIAALVIGVLAAAWAIVSAVSEPTESMHHNGQLELTIRWNDVVLGGHDDGGGHVNHGQPGRRVVSSERGHGLADSPGARRAELPHGPASRVGAVLVNGIDSGDGGPVDGRRA
jgi:hypothetical protein